MNPPTPTIIITGANGFIGSELVKHFSGKGWKVIALVHHVPKEKIESVNYKEYDLSLSPDEQLFTDADYLIHGAYVKHDSHPDAYEINIQGAKNILSLSRKYNLKKNIFLSSISSRADALSNYGKQKFAIEKLFNIDKDLVIRPGLVIGNGGLVKEMTEFIKRKGVVPLIGSGKQPIQTVAVDDLISFIDAALTNEFTGTITIAEPNAITYKEFYKALSKQINSKPLFIPMPFFIAEMVLSVAKLVGMKLPVTKENLLGLKNNRYIDTSEDLKKIGMVIKTYKESLEGIK
jgi:nucleoside-diphosphate-sugar epimerase